jgi:hypothetical protein
LLVELPSFDVVVASVVVVVLAGGRLFLDLTRGVEPYDDCLGFFTENKDYITSSINEHTSIRLLLVVGHHFFLDCRLCLGLSILVVSIAKLLLLLGTLRVIG